MAAYAIMRCKKLTGMGSVAAALQHCYRDRETPNADQARTPENEHLAASSTTQAMGDLRDLLPEKRRKDAVLAVEYVMTASPEWWLKATPEQEAEFFKRSLGWLADKYGEENIITATVHRDEKSPHLSAFVVPLTKDGRLSAKEFIGNREKMSRDQTTFADQVRDLGIERGIEGSRTTHQRIKTHYAALERAVEAAPRIHEQEIKPQKLRPQSLSERLTGAVETLQGVTQRLNAKIHAAFTPMAHRAATADQERTRAKEWQETARTLRDKVQAQEKIWGLLTREQVEKVKDLIKDFAKQNTREREIREQERKARDKGRDFER